MPLDVDDVLQLLAELADDDDLKVTVTESLKGGLITGLTAVVGGMLLGPPGLAIGIYMHTKHAQLHTKFSLIKPNLFVLYFHYTIRSIELNVLNLMMYSLPDCPVC